MTATVVNQEYIHVVVRTFCCFFRIPRARPRRQSDLRGKKIYRHTDRRQAGLLHVKDQDFSAASFQTPLQCQASVRSSRQSLQATLTGNKHACASKKTRSLLPLSSKLHTATSNCSSRLHGEAYNCHVQLFILSSR